MAIHCEPVSEETNPFASLETRWIAASVTPFPPRNDMFEDLNLLHSHHGENTTLVIGRVKPVAIRFEELI